MARPFKTDRLVRLASDHFEDMGTMPAWCAQKLLRLHDDAMVRAERANADGRPCEMHFDPPFHSPLGACRSIMIGQA